MPEEPPELTGLDDFDKVVASLNKSHVEFLIVGGYAVIFHGHMRSTKDLDILIRRTPENAKRAVQALEDAGFACPELTPELFISGQGITFGEPPVRIDVLSQIRGVAFEDAWSRRQTSRFGPQEANYIGLDDLLVNKEAVARPQDLADAQSLRLARERTAGGEGPQADDAGIGG